MLDADLPGTSPDTEERLSRRDFLFGIAVASAVALPVLSAPARAAVSMLHTGLDPELVKPESEIVRVGRGGGRGGGGRGGGGRGHGGGGRHHGGGGRHSWRWWRMVGRTLWASPCGGGRHHGGGHGHRNYGHRNYGHRNYGYRGYRGGRWYGGRWWGYGVGTCWQWTPGGLRLDLRLLAVAKEGPLPVLLRPYFPSSERGRRAGRSPLCIVELIAPPYGSKNWERELDRSPLSFFAIPIC